MGICCDSVLALKMDPVEAGEWLGSRPQQLILLTGTYFVIVIHVVSILFGDIMPVSEE